MLRIMMGRMIRRTRMAEKLTLRLYFVSGKISPIVMPIARRESGTADAPSQLILVVIGSGMMVSRWVKFRKMPMKTASMGPLRNTFGLSENLPVKIMMPMLKTASSMPRLCRNNVASNSLSP